jgi:hypothetical protein
MASEAVRVDPPAAFYCDDDHALRDSLIAANPA